MIRVDMLPTLPASMTVANTARNPQTARKVRRERRHRIGASSSRMTGKASSAPREPDMKAAAMPARSRPAISLPSSGLVHGESRPH